MFEDYKESIDDQKHLMFRRVRRIVVGAIAAAVLGLLLVNGYMYVQYGGTMFDRYFQKSEAKSPMAGKLAFDKGTKYYIGVIRGEGRSQRRGAVYYIEQAGGSMIEVSKENVEVREPRKAEE